MKRLSIFIVSVGLSSAVPAFGGAMTGGASEITQILNNVQLTQSYLEQIHQTAQQLEQLKTQIEIHKIHIENAKRISQGDMMIIEQYAKQLWEFRQEQLRRAWTASEVDELYRQRYPSYDEIMNGALDGKSLPDVVKDWYKNTNEEIQEVLKLNATSRDAIGDEEVQNLKAIIESTTKEGGHMALLQTSNKIAEMQIDQLQELRKVITYQTDLIGKLHAADKAHELAVAEKLSRMHAPIEFKEKKNHSEFWPKIKRRKR